MTSDGGKVGVLSILKITNDRADVLIRTTQIYTLDWSRSAFPLHCHQGHVAQAQTHRPLRCRCATVKHIAAIHLSATETCLEHLARVTHVSIDLGRLKLSIYSSEG